MDNHPALRRLFGEDDFGFADLPRKIGNRTISRIVAVHTENTCGFCFPHGSDTPNATRKKNRRSWKYSRKTQYREKIR